MPDNTVKLIIFILVMIIGVWTAVQAFNNRLVSRNRRFALSMGVLAILLAFMAMTFTTSDLVFWIAGIVIIVVFACCAPSVWRGVKRSLKERRKFNRVAVICQMYVVISLQRRDILHLGAKAINDACAFIGQVSKAHRKTARQFARDVIKVENRNDEISAEHKYSDDVVEDLINDYWKKYKD